MHHTGHVALVGAGPGAPGLLTLRGKQLLEAADVVLYDRLVGTDILAMIPENAEAIDVGKSPGRHLTPQETINEAILQHARLGRRVVRLKGGDPYLFGRGAEELEAVMAEGIPFEVVPGITSAIAVPSFAGIPVTHRDHVSSVHIITGHVRHGGVLDIPYANLVGLGGTLVFLMGVGAIAQLTDGLIQAGMDKETPAALVENGTRPQQRELTAPLHRIAAEAKQKGYRPPSVLIVGSVCNLAPKLNWMSRLPLSGIQVLVTRAKASSGEFAQRLREKGCAVTECPCIHTHPLPVGKELVSSFERADWLVFTSQVGVDLFFAQLSSQGRDTRALHRTKVAAVGAKTAAALRAHGIRPDYVPDTYHAKVLASGLPAQKGQRILLFRAKKGNPVLAEQLQRAGMQVEDIAAYETLYESPPHLSIRELLEGGEVDYVAFTSASTVHGFAGSFPGLDPKQVTGVCIGEETAAAARGYGYRVLVSREATIESMVTCLEEAVQANGRAGSPHTQQT